MKSVERYSVKVVEEQIDAIFEYAKLIKKLKEERFNSSQGL